MGDNAEEGIARVQLARDQNLSRRQRWSIAYLDERIFIYLMVLAVVGLLVIWLTAKSALVLYGSLGVAVLFVFLWGLARIARINRIKQERAQQVAAIQSKSRR